MKRIILLCAYVLITASCEEIEKLTEFDLEYESSITIKKTTGLDLPLAVLTPDIKTNSESEFAVNDTRKDMVEEIRLTSLELNVISPDNQTFSFIKSIEVFIVAEGLPKIRVAQQDNVPEDIGQTLTLETSEDDLKEYIKKDKFELSVETVTDEVISQDIDIEVDSRFFVNARILGV